MNGYSEFKRENLERYSPEDLLPKKIQLINMPLWSHLKGTVPNVIMNEIDESVEETIEELEHLGIVRRGGNVEQTDYPSDDYLTLTRSGLDQVSSGEPVFDPVTDDGDQFDQRDFHSDLNSTVRDLFADGYYSQAIFEACKLLNSKVKALSGSSGDGSSLMTQVFSPGKPVLRLNDLKNKSDKDEQQGFMRIYEGTMIGIRNPKAHEIVTLNDQTKALEYLSLISLLLRLLDGAKK